MDKYLSDFVRLLLVNTFFEDNKNKLLSEFFPGNLQNLYKLICKTHDKHHKDITLVELKALYKHAYPTTTYAQWELLEKFLDNLPGEVSENVAKEIIQKAWTLHQGEKIAQIGLDICNGKEVNIQKVREILEKINEGSFLDGDDDLVQVSSEIEDILEAMNVTTKWSFNLPGLRTVANGLGPGIFTIVAARVETGKTAFGVSLACGPEGLADQGAIVHFYCNEEAPQRTQARSVMSYTGMPLQELVLLPDKAKKLYKNVRERIKFFDCRGKSIYDIEKHVAKHKPDTCIIDQLDKVSINGTFQREDERLGALYATTRDIGQRCGSAMIGITQLSADAEGKAFISSANLANARTSKAAEGDLVIGIGKPAGHNENTRLLNMIKNKITGLHDDVICMIRPEISRYIS